MVDKKNLSATDNRKSEAAKAEKTGKHEKPARKKRPGIRVRTMKFFRDSKGEFKKIIWPTRQNVVRNTGATLAMCAVIGFAVSFFDLGLSALVKLMMSL